VRVLLVDDQEILLQSLCDLLSVRGHEVVGTVTNGAAALEAVAQTNPDLVLVDVRLTNESGLNIARALTTAHHELAVVLMSMAQVAAADIRASGARSVITKEQLSRVDLEALAK
jgi:two-component system, NarL family, nitrate/nitrite response regulator NarL